LTPSTVRASRTQALGRQSTPVKEHSGDEHSTIETAIADQLEPAHLNPINCGVEARIAPYCHSSIYRQPRFPPRVDQPGGYDESDRPTRQSAGKWHVRVESSACRKEKDELRLGTDNGVVVLANEADEVFVSNGPLPPDYDDATFD
jgi:hypothetical protein